MTTKFISSLLKIKGKSVYLVLFSLIYTILFPQYSWAYSGFQDQVLVLNYSQNSQIDEYSDFAIIQGNSLMQVGSPETPETKIGPVCPVVSPYGTCPAPKVVSKKTYASTGNKLVTITAYSSSVDETDASPFITASGAYVRDGIIAANFLKIGTQVKIPALYGDKIFVVEDRMAAYNYGKVDIWMPSKGEAIQFGVKRAEIVVLEN